MISVLYTRKDSVYKSMGLDCWDFERDANRYGGGNVVIAHPPCRGWGRFKAFATGVRPGELELAIKAVNKIRLYGGVLEHPHASSLWRRVNLPRPGQYDNYGGFCIHVNQCWFGHNAQKSTWLYVNGCSIRDVPRIPVSLVLPLKKVEYMCVKEREATPLAFATWLVDLAKVIAQKKNELCLV
jgi:hypothetical protein